jgi:hypothetical protein
MLSGKKIYIFSVQDQSSWGGKETNIALIKDIPKTMLGS